MDEDVGLVEVHTDQVTDLTVRIQQGSDILCRGLGAARRFLALQPGAKSA